MAHPVIRLFDGVDDTAPFRFDLAPTGGTPREVEAIAADLQAAVDKGAQWVVFGHHEPTAHPDLADILWEVDEHGIRARMTTIGTGLGARGVLEALRDAGLAQLVITFYGGTAATHDRVVGIEGAFDEAIAALEQAAKLNSLLTTARYVLLRDNHTEVRTFVERVRLEAKRLELVRLSALTRDIDQLRAQGVPRRAALEAIQQAWEAAREVNLRMETQAFGTWPTIPVPSPGAVQPVDLSLLELLRSNVPVPATVNGTWASPLTGGLEGIWFAVDASRSVEELGLQLAAYGCPALDLPVPWGGKGLSRPPGIPDAEAITHNAAGIPEVLASAYPDATVRRRPATTGVGRRANVHVVDGFLTDNVLAMSSLPALTQRLREAGATATLHSVWHAPHNPFDHELPLVDDALAPSTDPNRPGVRFPDAVVESLASQPARYAHARKHTPAFLAALDLAGADLVVVPGFDNALAVLDNPSLPAEARVVIPDFHLMTGIGPWHQRWSQGGRSMEGGWWPSERLVVHALYPRYVRAYWRAGVPLRQVLWRPYPIDTGHFPEGPAVTDCNTIFSGGAHQRDWRTLARAAHLLGDTLRHPIEVHTRDEVPAPLRNLGEVRLLHFYESIANSRFVVLPLDPDPRRPAGISVISMALAAGRPVIASSTLATIDHLRHGHNAILVPPHHPRALAAAIERLDGDDALLAKLSAGARASAAHLSVRAWAHTLLDGAPDQALFTMEDGETGPFYSWPA